MYRFLDSMKIKGTSINWRAPRVGLRRSLTIALLGFIFSMTPSWANPDDEWHEETSASGLMIVQSHDSWFSGSLMDILNRLAYRLQGTSGLIPSPNTHLIMRVESWDNPITNQAPIMTGWASGSTLNLQITIRQRPQHGAEDLLRNVVAAILYQSIYQDGAKETVGKPLIKLPIWIVEGLLQGLIDGNPEQNTRIALRANKLKKTPTLETIMSWTALSNEKLERCWQQAFCFEALQFVQSDAARWEATKKWLIARAQNMNTTSLPWPIDEQIEDQWQHSQVNNRFSSEPLILSWDHIVSELSSMQTVTLPATKTEPEAIISFDKLTEHRAHPEFMRVISVKIADLTVLEMRAGFMWSSVIQEYRFALMSLTNSTASDKIYLQKLVAARKMTAELSEFGKRVEDYLNWFEVTKRTPVKESSFESLFHLQDQLDGDSNKMQPASEPDLITIEKRM